MLVHQRVSWGPYFPKPYPRHRDLVAQLQGLAFQISQAFLEVLAAHLVHIEARKQTMSWKPHQGDQQYMYIYVYLFIYHIYIYIHTHIYGVGRCFNLLVATVGSCSITNHNFCRCLKMASPHGFMKFHEHRQLRGANV